MISRESRARLGAALILLALSLGLVLSPAAASAEAWLPAATLTPPASSISSVTAGSDANGDVTIAWIQHTGSEYVVEAATRPAGGSFAVAPVQAGTGPVSNLSVSVNASGAAILAWRRQGTTSEVWASTRPAGGGFGPPQAISAVPGMSSLDPSVAINDAGDAMVVWRLAGGSPTYTETIYGSFRPRSGGFGSPQPISSSDAWNQSPRVALDQTGRATIVWSYWDGSSTNIARVRVREPSGALGQQRNLSPSAPTGFSIFATVGLDALGNAVAVWSHWNGSIFEVEGAIRQAASDVWTNLPAFGQSAGGNFGSEPQVSVQLSGAATSIWQAADNTINAAGKAPGASFGAAQTGISAPSASAPRVVSDPTGGAVAVWQRNDGEGARIEASERPSDGLFGAVARLSPQKEATGPALSIDAEGNAVAAWILTDPDLPSGANTFVQYAVLDRSPPKLTSVSVPATGTAGSPSRFAASAIDTWSPAAIAWDFGDGTSGSGSTVSHAYGTPGTYVVRVTATDASGHSSSRTAPISIGSPPASAPIAITAPAVRSCRHGFRKKQVGGVVRCVRTKPPLRCRKGFKKVKVKVRRHGKVVKGKNGKPKTKIVCKKIKKHRKKHG